MTAIHRVTVTVGSPEHHFDLGSQELVLSTAPARDGTEAVDVWFVDHGEGDGDGQDPSRHVSIDIYGTGHVLDSIPGKFVGTCVMGSGLVWHVFARNMQ